MIDVVNFNIHYNFLIIRDADFIFCMHTQLMTPFQMTPKVNDHVTLTSEFTLKITVSDSAATKGIVFHKFILLRKHTSLVLPWSFTVYYIKHVLVEIPSLDSKWF